MLKSASFGLRNNSSGVAFKPFFVLLAALMSCVLLVLILARAYYSGITFDEAHTYLYYATEPIAGSWRDVVRFDLPNNHLLNTVLVKLLEGFSPYTEWLIRLPNVIAFGGFAYFATCLSLQTGSRIAATSVFLALMLNPYQIEFFGLARGYGLASSFGLASMYFFRKAVDEERLAIESSIGGGSFFAMLAVWSNFSFIYLAVTLPIALQLTRGASLFQWFTAFRDSRQWKTLWPYITIVSVAAVVAAVPIMMGLGGFGAKHPVWDAVYDSLVRQVIRVARLSVSELKMVTAVIIIGWLGLFLLIRQRRLFFSNALLTATLLVSLMSWVLNKPLITQRTALFFYPLLVLSFVELLSRACYTESEFVRRLKWFGLTLFFVVAAVNFYFGYELKKTRDWRQDYGIGDAVKTYTTFLRTNGYAAGTPRLCLQQHQHPSAKFYAHRARYYRYQPIVVVSGIHRKCDAFYVDPKKEFTHPKAYDTIPLVRGSLIIISGLQ